jgi:hypothetical protein
MAAERFSPFTQCEGKRPFSHKRYAKAHARVAEQGIGRMQVYRCPHCGRWHVGHKVPAAHKTSRVT